MPNIPRQAQEEDPAYRVRKPVGPPPLDSESEVERAKQDQDMDEGNFLQPVSELAQSWDANRQTAIQGAGNFVTDITGNKTLGGVTKFAGEVLYPESWELPLMTAAAAIPFEGPLGEATIYGTGAVNRLRRGLKGVKAAGVANLSNVIEDAFSSANSAWKRISTDLDHNLFPNPLWRQVQTAGGPPLDQLNQPIMKMVAKGGGGTPVNPGSVGKFSPQPKEIGYAFVRPTQSEIGDVTTKLLNQHVLTGPNRVFDYNAFRSILDSDRARSIAILLESTPHTKIPNWKTHRKGLVDVFESIYGDAMQVLGIPRKQIQIDHLVTLRSSMPLYDNVSFGSPLWNNIQETLLRTKNKYQPGNSLANLNALDPGSHVIKTNFFNNTLGKNGELFFTPDKLEFMKKSDANRMEVLKDFIKIQDKGTQILHEAQKVWETIYKPGAKLPIDIVNELSKIPITKYSHPELRNLPKLRKLIEHIVKEDADDIIKNIDRGKDLLINRINDPNLKIRVNNRKKNILPTPRQVQTKIQEGSKPYQPTLDPEGGMFIK